MFEEEMKEVLEKANQKKKLVCFMDGNALSIVEEGFNNLQEDEAVFIEVSPEDRRKIIDFEYGGGCPDWGMQKSGVMSGCGKCQYCIEHEND